MREFASIAVPLGVLVFAVLVVVTMWNIFTKAGRPGWACLIPVYNWFVLLDIAGMSGWWFLLWLVPYVGWIVPVVITLRLAGAFRKSTLFGFGMVLLPFIFYPLLAFREEERWYGAEA